MWKQIVHSINRWMDFIPNYYSRQNNLEQGFPLDPWEQRLSLLNPNKHNFGRKAMFSYISKKFRYNLARKWTQTLRKHWAIHQKVNALIVKVPLIIFSPHRYYTDCCLLTFILCSINSIRVTLSQKFPSDQIWGFHWLSRPERDFRRSCRISESVGNRRNNETEG